MLILSNKNLVCAQNELPLPRFFQSGTTPVAFAELSLCAFVRLTDSYFSSNTEEQLCCAGGRIGILCPLAASASLVYPETLLFMADPTWRLFTVSAVGVNGSVMRLLDSQRICPCVIDERFTSAP